MIRFFPAFLLVGCYRNVGSSAQNVRCEPIDVVVLAPGEDSPLGFGGDDVLALAEGAHGETLTFDVGGQTPLLVTVTYEGGEMRFEDREWVGVLTGVIDPALGGCDDIVAVDVHLDFVTQAGAFDESFDLPLVSSDGVAATFHQELNLPLLGGSFVVTTEIDPTDWDQITAFLEGAFDASGSSGVVQGLAVRFEDPDLPDPDTIELSTSFRIAVWGPQIPVTTATQSRGPMERSPR